MFGPSLMNQNELSLEVANAEYTFCFEVMNTVILQDYCFLPDGTLCDALKRIFFWSIICNDCKNTVFHMLGPSLMNQNKFSLSMLRPKIHHETSESSVSIHDLWANI